jgi:hypothetical protein
MEKSLVIGTICRLSDELGWEICLNTLDRSCRLFGSKGVLTSIQLVHLIAELEQMVLDDTGHMITLVTGESRKKSVLINVGTLDDYLVQFYGRKL